MMKIIHDEGFKWLKLNFTEKNIITYLNHLLELYFLKYQNTSFLRYFLKALGFKILVLILYLIRVAIRLNLDSFSTFHMNVFLYKKKDEFIYIIHFINYILKKKSGYKKMCNVCNYCQDSSNHSIIPSMKNV